MDSDGVAILIAAKDSAATIANAVGSALTQPEAQEVLVLDDGSSDATAERARACDDGSGRLRVYVFERNRGPSAARNRLLAEARAPLVCVLDADDYMRQGRLQGMLAAGGQDWDLLADDLMFAAEAEPDRILDTLLGDEEPTPQVVAPAAFITRCLNNPTRPRREMAFLKPLIRREFLEAHGLAYDERLRLGEDYVLYVRCLMEGARLRLIGAQGYVAVERSNSLSGTHTTHDLDAFLDADERLLAEASDPEIVEALTRHVRQLRRNRDFREMLDRRHRGDLTGVMRLMLRRPDSARHVLLTLLKRRLA